MEKIAADLLLKGLAPEGFADSQPIGRKFYLQEPFTEENI